MSARIRAVMFVGTALAAALAGCAGSAPPAEPEQSTLGTVQHEIKAGMD